MAVISTNSFGARLRPVQALIAIVAKIAAWNDGRATRKALCRLSDHELDDLGLCRGDIDDIVAGRRSV